MGLMLRLGAEFTANTTTAGTQRMARVASLASGGFVVVWTSENGDSDGFGIVAQRFDADGNKVGGEIVVNNVTAGDQLAPSVAGLASGGFVVSWDGTSDFSGTGVSARVFGADGVPLGGEFVANTQIGNDQRHANAFALPGGGFVVAFLHEHQVVNEYRYSIRAQIFDSAGTKIGSDFQISASDDVIQGSPQGLALSGGRFVIVWGEAKVGGPGEDYDIFGQILDSAGNRIGEQFRVQADDADWAFEPDIATLAGGGFVVSWHSFDTVSHVDEPHAQMFDEFGARLGPEVVANNPGDGYTSISVTGIPSGGFLVSWENALANSPRSLRGQLFDASGARVAGQVELNTNAFQAGSADLATLADGRIAAAWDNGIADVEGQVFRAPRFGTPVADTLVAAGGAEALAGLAGDDHLTGSAGADSLDGGAGDDLLAGGAGADELNGGAGTDTADYSVETGGGGIRFNLANFAIYEGNDLIIGALQARDSYSALDTLAGIENARGGDGNDLFWGDAGANRFEGGAGDDVLRGLSGADILLGGTGDDTLEGGGENDLLDGGAGADTMRGGTGDDVYVVDNAGDTVSENAAEGVDEIRTSLAIYSLAGTNLENLAATNDASHDFRGNLANNVITGGGGNDTIRAYDGGNDTVHGGAGDDLIFIGAALTAADVIDGGANNDTLIIQGNYFGGLTLTSNVTNIENLSILNGANTNVGAPGTELYDYVITTNDATFGAGVQARVNAGALLPGEDFTFNGSAETDASFVIYGGRGVDTLTGGLGNDIFFFAEKLQFAPGDTVNGGAGYDSVYFRGNYTIDFNAPGYAGQFNSIESITLTSASDTRYARGGPSEFDYSITLADANLASGVTLTINGTLLQSFETMVVDGSQETDGFLRIFAGLSDDTIKGGGQADLIHGNFGADTLTGGGGADTFRYQKSGESTAASLDHILDFTPGTDKIELTRMDANTLAAGNQDFHWIGSAAFAGTGAGSAGELRVFEQTGTWFVEGDTNGDGTGDFLIALTLQGATPLSQGDFFL
ncbi:MAG: calcium-binding protein [Allosphingosinicella sp.]